MEDKQILAIFINLIFWPLIFYWIWRAHKSSVESKRRVEEFNKPENKFKREVSRLQLTLQPFEGRSQYPYILTPHHSDRVNAKKPTDLRGNEILKGYEYKYLLKDVKIGKSEHILYNSLVTAFDKKLIQSGSLCLFGFYPDLTYLDLDKKIFIDIEIDEAYSLKSKEPIHYLSTIDMGNGKIRTEDSNKERDDVFRKNGWTVIRFSEEQIIKFTDECVEIIRNVVCYWELTKSQYRFDDTKLTVQPRWTVHDAREMATKDSRRF